MLFIEPVEKIVGNHPTAFSKTVVHIFPIGGSLWKFSIVFMGLFLPHAGPNNLHNSLENRDNLLSISSLYNIASGLNNTFNPRHKNVGINIIFESSSRATIHSSRKSAIEVLIQPTIKIPLNTFLYWYAQIRTFGQKIHLLQFFSFLFQNI